MKPTDGNPHVTAALARMAMFRQAEPSGLTLELYSAQLASELIAVEDILTACNVLARRERAEGETAFPSLGTLLAACQTARRHREDREADARILPMPPPYQPRDLSPEEAKAWVTRLRRDVEARRREITQGGA